MTGDTDKAREQYKATSDDLKIVESVVSELLKMIGTKTKSEVSIDESNEAILVNLEAGDESGLLIGSRGDTLNSLQMIIAMIARKKCGHWIRVIVNIADWREKQNEKLESLATQTAERVISTGEPQSLYNLNATQRRIVHMTLSQNKDVETESVGEGQDRYLKVKPK